MRSSARTRRGRRPRRRRRHRRRTRRPLVTPPARPQVSVLHGVPGLTVDVYANGNKLLTNFKPGTLTDPVALPEGTYDLKVFAGRQRARAARRRSRPRASRCRPAPNITVVAHLDAPTASRS